MEIKKKHIAILGSTGSIGVQALEVIDAQKDLFEVEVLTANSNWELLVTQAKKFRPNVVVIAEQSKYKIVNEALFDLGIKVYAGEDAIAEVVEMDIVDLIITALVGFAGLKPTIQAIKAGKNIALANKETLVVAGCLVNKLCEEYGASIYPIDSEHSAIFQCLVGETCNPIEKIYLTASGGPFRGLNRKELSNVKKEHALKHPNWEMGAKITIDSASLMNKGLEVIEAKWLFDLGADQIDVVVHPQSIIHSAVQFEDGSIKAQLGAPDMKLPIQYALGFPERLKNSFKRFSFMDYPNLTFEKPDLKTFRSLQLAYNAMEKGGNMPCILNAANEMAVAAFLQDKIGFLNMPDLITNCMEKITFAKNPSYEDFLETDKQTRILAKKLL